MTYIPNQKQDLQYLIHQLLILPNIIHKAREFLSFPLTSARRSENPEKTRRLSSLHPAVMELCFKKKEAKLVKQSEAVIRA